MFVKSDGTFWFMVDQKKKVEVRCHNHGSQVSRMTHRSPKFKIRTENARDPKEGSLASVATEADLPVRRLTSPVVNNPETQPKAAGANAR